jgi:hypothetical protein
LCSAVLCWHSVWWMKRKRMQFLVKLEFESLMMDLINY